MTTSIQQVYVTYIAASAERVWQALTDGDLARHYWNGAIETDWQPGSRWEHRRNGSTAPAVIGGTIVERSAPHRLVMTWAGLPDDQPAKRSRVTFEIERIADGKGAGEVEGAGEVVRLTVTHSELDAAMANNVNGGWPRVLSSLKSLLETGKPIDAWMQSACST